MGTAHHQHGQTGLADAAANGQGQLVVQQHLVEGQRPAVIAARLPQLAVQGLGIYPDAHGGNLQRPVQYRIPEKDVAVQVPVIIVRGTTVMGFAGAKLAADLHNAGGLMIAKIRRLPLRAGFQVGIQVFQFLGGDEGNLPAQFGAQLGVADMEPIIGIAYCPDNGSHNQLQVVQIPVFPGNDLLPVPLVHVDGVKVVQVLIPADGVHIRIESIAHGEVVPLQGQPLPFGQRMHHLGISLHRRNVKGNRALIAVQVVIQAGVLRDKQWGGDPFQIQCFGEFFLKCFFDVGNGPLSVVGVQHRLIALGNIHFVHKAATFPLALKDGSIVFILLDKIKYGFSDISTKKPPDGWFFAVGGAGFHFKTDSQKAHTACR